MYSVALSPRFPKACVTPERRLDGRGSRVFPSVSLSLAASSVAGPGRSHAEAVPINACARLAGFHLSLHPDLVAVQRLVCPEDPQMCWLCSWHPGERARTGFSRQTEVQPQLNPKPGSNPESSMADQAEDDARISMAVKAEGSCGQMEASCCLGLSLAAGLRSPPCQDCAVSVSAEGPATPVYGSVAQRIGL